MKDEVEEKEEDLYKEVVEAANYVSEHSMMHYDGSFQTTELFLENEELETRLQETIDSIDNIKRHLEGQIEELEQRTSNTDIMTSTVEETKQEAEQTLEQLEPEIQQIKKARERPPEQEADRGYIDQKGTEAKTLVENMDYTPTGEEI